jgi:L-threonylcarbamoyladenylate synthase
MKIITQLDEALQCIATGKIIAYPTEAVYGLGCDPFNQQAVETILNLKCRSEEKGLIILIADWGQLMPLVDKVPAHLLQKVRATWPGPVTWIFPKSSAIPKWLTGEHNGIAIRMTAHPIAHALCAKGPIVSTSANLSGQEPAKDVAGVHAQFPHGVEGVVAGELGGATQPSKIYDVLTAKQIR